MFNPEILLAHLICSDKSYLEIAHKFLTEGESGLQQAEAFGQCFRCVLKEDNALNRLQYRFLCEMSEVVSWPRVAVEVRNIRRNRPNPWLGEERKRKPTMVMDRSELDKIICL